MRNNKYIFLMVLMVFLILITFVAQNLTMTLGTDISNNVPIYQQDNNFNLLMLIRTFLGIMTFSIAEIPAWLTILVFYPITFAIGALIIDTIFGKT
jgi:hypothetical protein